MARDFKAIMAWWREMAQRNKKCDLNPVHPTLECFSTGKLSTNTPSEKALIVCDENEVNCLQKNAASRIQLGWRSFILCNSVRRQHSAATKIQTYYRCWLLRKAFVNQKHAVIIIQNMFKCIKCWRDFQQFKIAAGLLSAVCSAIAGVVGLSFEATRSCRLKAGETGTLTSLGVFGGLLLFGYHGACCLLCVPTKFCCCAAVLLLAWAARCCLQFGMEL